MSASDKQESWGRHPDAQNVPSQRAAERTANIQSAPDVPKESAKDRVKPFPEKGQVLSGDQAATHPATEGKDAKLKSRGGVTECSGDRRLGHVPTCPVELAGDVQRVELLHDYKELGYDKGRVFSVPCAIQYVSFRSERIS